MKKRKRTPGYLIFYILFLPDTWRILIGLAAAYCLAPFVVYADMAAGGKAMLFIMIATIGYAASGLAAGWITRALKRVLLGDKQS